MDSKMLFLLISSCHIIGAWDSMAGGENQNWKEPNAWAKEVESNSLQTLDGFCTCNKEDLIPESSIDNQAAMMIFSKFIKFLFNREKLVYDEQYSLYQRELVFTVLPEQLEKLEKLTDPRDLDGVLTEILRNARIPNKYNRNSGTWSSIFALFWDILKDLVMLLRFSEVKFLLFVLSFVLFAWFMHRRHKVGLFLVVVSSFLVIGYFFTYLECNRELEIAQMLEVIERNEATNPNDPSWYNSISNWWYGDTERISMTQRRERIKKESKLNIAFCLPDHVLMMYLNKLFFTNLQFIIEKCIETLNTLNALYYFPYNCFAAIALIALIAYTLKLTFKYILNPAGWISYHRNKRSASIQGEKPESTSHHQDCLSGENLRSLLNAIKPPNVYVNNASINSGSCVQDVPSEGFDEALQDKSDSHNSSNDSISEATISKSELNLPQKSSSSNNLVKSESSDKSEGDFVLISELDSKGTSEELKKKEL